MKKWFLISFAVYAIVDVGFAVWSSSSFPRVPMRERVGHFYVMYGGMTIDPDSRKESGFVFLVHSIINGKRGENP